jgi:hypothetical protein
MPSQSRNFAGAKFSYVDPPTTVIDGNVGNDEPIGRSGIADENLWQRSNAGAEGDNRVVVSLRQK